MLESLPSIAQSVPRIHDAALDPVELLEFCLERIARLESSIRAWVLVDAQQARQQAGRLTDGGAALGPLCGVPIGIKDIIDVAGWPTQAGSTSRDSQPAERDADVVRRLRQAGAILLGKTVTTPFACFDPPPTRNPWNLDHTPGGSSSGSAAAVALDMCQAALGTQTGGSLMRPATYCGICSLKPTYGALSTEGVLPVSFHLDHVGPMARSVPSLAALWDVLSEREVGSRRSPISEPPRLRRLGGFFDRHATEQARQASDVALRCLQRAGATVVHAKASVDWDAIPSLHRRIMAAEVSQVHKEAFQADGTGFPASVAQLIEEGLAVGTQDYIAALKHRWESSRQMLNLFDQADVLVTAATTGPAPADLRTTGDPILNLPWSYTGLPTLCLPCGLAPNGLPCGLQLIAPPFQETRLLATAAWCERQLGFEHRPAVQP